MQKVLLSKGDDLDFIVVNENEVSKCLFSADFDNTILADAKKVDLKNIPESEYGDEVLCWLREQDIGYVQLEGDGAFREPATDEYTVVYSRDNIEIGDDPHFWDYDFFVYSYWDGSNTVEYVAQSSTDVKEVHTHVLQDEKVNYGRALYYSVYEDDQGEFYGECDNAGYYGPGITEKINYRSEMTDEEIEEAINEEL